jgi:hypothetical protein
MNNNFIISFNWEEKIEKTENVKVCYSYKMDCTGSGY